MNNIIFDKSIYAPHYCSHFHILIKVIQQSTGPVLEVGTGMFSTPLLHWLCIEGKRLLVSYDNDPKYFNINKAFANNGHQIKLVKDWTDMNIDDTHWSVAFIDHEPTIRRKEEVKRLANNVDYIILHDSEISKDKYFQYSEIYSLFKYRYNYCRQKPYTTVLSNFKKLTHLRG